MAGNKMVPLFKDIGTQDIPGTTIDYYPALHRVRKSRMLSDITHIVLHETGVGIYKRRGKFPTASDKELALHVYQNIMPYCGHYVIGADGRASQTVKLRDVAEHVGSTGSAVYRELDKTSSVKKIPAWWREESAHRFNLVPATISAWRKKSCNAVSVGIEIVSPQERGAPLTGIQAHSVVVLLEYLRGVLPNLRYILTHAMVHPRSRTTLSGKRYDMTQDRYKQVVDAARGSKVESLMV